MSNDITARKNGQWTVLFMAPDVCKTPVGSAIVPIPYPVVAKLGDAVKTVPNVKANGDPVLTISGHIPTTLGDQAGVQKGIKSGTVGKAAFYRSNQHSSTVRAGKQRILRHGDLYWMNGNPPSGKSGKAAKSAPPPAPKKPKVVKPEKVQLATSLEEAKNKLLAAAPAVQAAKAAGKPLPKSAYTQADKQAVVDSGATERFMVRVVPTKYAGDDGYIAPKREHGATVGWMAPLSMVEHGDTDAEALLNAFGTRHDPDEKYTVLIIDTHKMNEVADVKTIIPTNKNLQQLITDNPQITKVSPEVSKQVLSEDFAPKYYKFAKGMNAAGTDQKEIKEMEDFAQSQGFTKKEAKLLCKRHQLAKDVSAWEEFTGNGMTMDTNVKGKTAYGPVELVMLDKSPKALGELKKNKAILSLAAN